MRPVSFHWRRFLEWLADRDVAWANARIVALLTWRDVRAGDAARHGVEADRICPPAGPNGAPPPAAAPPEWDPRFSARHADNPKAELRSQP